MSHHRSADEKAAVLAASAATDLVEALAYTSLRLVIIASDALSTRLRPFSLAR